MFPPVEGQQRRKFACFNLFHECQACSVRQSVCSCPFEFEHLVLDDAWHSALPLVEEDGGQVRDEMRERLLDLSVADAAIVVDVELAEEPLVDHPADGRLHLGVHPVAGLDRLDRSVEQDLHLGS
ncbi:hypothetical protein CH249_06965 [Rhodococcus sp. 05-2255-3B1]|uniref:hypothetical protein n=1 Tax=unclassified Rhodococcus (in: high G+C Gram-positive bacteria) TaxID=192944 RepID=UPI000B9C5A4C|nr:MULTISPECIES: hypothetical protein [unclassified Rhodococcus (in: high G+C Gram-positive bacteria)]OZE11007.1 hypothetical protein CH250_11020 [Rhodococcus sp. 05-2255-3C]OZE14164.1 hypothetical protein CH249_06965 [Rhodococcus sp. 05-2255-3B1]OZE24735.1 hypothetical protein CH255_00840 [Rhodococcus sp. 05-2255-2A2]